MTQQYEAKNGLVADDLIYRDFIDRIGKGFFSEPYPGYPTVRFQDSLFRSSDTIPDGPWSTGMYGDTPDLIELEALGHIAKDILGRPLHPWLSDMVRHPQAGVVTGKGAYWHWGPNFTADPIVITKEIRPRILLIERSDTRALALPGGFVDRSDKSPEEASRRELFQETGLELNIVGKVIYQGIVADKRTTAHAWAETTAVLYVIPKALPVEGSDDALNADWQYIDQIDQLLFGSHNSLVKLALNYEKE